MKKFKILDNFTLKIIAAFAMLIDHIGYVFAYQLPYEFMIQLRIFGRISFPIFAFLIVQGFLHTSNRMNYLARIMGFGVGIILLLALLSRTLGVEVPSSLNIFITLGFGILALWWIELYWETSWLITSVVVFLGVLLVDFMHVDYGAYGVLTIVLFYVTRNNPLWMVLGFSALTAASVGADMLRVTNASTIQLYAVAALPLLLMYNGEKGKYSWKYFFYVFYPVHFGILILIKYFLF